MNRPLVVPSQLNPRRRASPGPWKRKKGSLSGPVIMASERLIGEGLTTMLADGRIEGEGIGAPVPAEVHAARSAAESVRAGNRPSIWIPAERMLGFIVTASAAKERPPPCCSGTEDPLKRQN